VNGWKKVTNSYYFIARWRVKASAKEVFSIISEPLEYPRWWPAVYLEAKEMMPGEARGVGRRVRFLTRGFLPYTLRWESTVLEAESPHRLVVRATGDFDGRGIWSLVEDGEYCDITFDWKLLVEKPGVRELSFALRPLFEANHRWAMERGEESLKLELARTWAHTPQELKGVPRPKLPPEREHGLLSGAAVLAITLGAVFAWRGR
jgi:uncharacterized protein YndB with AHSA1/START domain